MMKQRTNRAVRTLAAASTLGLVASMLVSGAQSDDAGRGVQEARTALEKWVETRRILSAERRDWALGREMLAERIELVQREIESLRASIGEAEGNIAEADRKRAELLVEEERLSAAAAVLGTAVGDLEQGTRRLVARLPEPLRERVRPLTQQFPEDPQATELGLAQRYQNVVGTLNAVNKFNREVSAFSEVRPLADGSASEVTALYLGIGQGWYVNAAGDLAGIGTASEDAWVWTPADEHAPAVAEAVAIQRGERPPAFVQLPIRIQ
jgi:hypothetical protein